MAAEETSKSYPMKGGDGLYSYANNSSYQRGVIDAAKTFINDSVAEKLDINDLISSETFRIADLGCSSGPNTFFAVQNIIEAVQLKYQCPEFQVFFNDHTSNDFNTLFTSVPPDRKYYASGVPGSFYCRLFPNASLHFVHCSYAIHWLSKVPKAVVDKSSPAWNKGRIHYSNSIAVVKAYEAQFAEDMECFLHARAQEVVHGGLIALIVPGRPNGTPHYQTSPSIFYGLLGSCLIDMVRKGMVSEEKVDSFNLPLYFMSPEELEAAVERNRHFSIEKMENIPRIPIPAGTLNKTQAFISHVRAALGELIKEQFGEVIIGELFDSYSKKLEQDPSIFVSGKGINFFVLLRRKAMA